MLYVRIYKKNEIKKAYLFIDFGYVKKVLSWDISLCAECLKISVYELYQIEDGVYKVC